jgi:adenylate cyclase
VARERLGLSREGLAEASRGPHPLSIATIKRAESGSPVYLESARRLASLLQTPLSALVDAAKARALACHEPAEAPSIAVLPLRPIGADQATQWLADGLTEDLLHRLGSSWFPVLARTCTQDLDASAPTLLDSCVEKNIAYFVEGSARRADDALRLSVRLVETSTGQVVWTNAYDRPFSHTLRVQSELSEVLVSELARKVLIREGTRLQTKEPTDLNAWQLGLRGAWHFHHRTREHNEAARSHLMAAVRRDPDQPLAWYTLALSHQQDILNQWAAPSETLTRLADIVTEFLRVHPSDPRAAIAAAYVDIYTGRRDAAAIRLKSAIELNPNLADAYSLYGQTLAMAGDPDPALEQFEMALRLSPGDSEGWRILTSVALAHFVAERYEESIVWVEKAIAASPTVAFCYGVLATCHAHLGNLLDAKAAMRSMQRIEPTLSLGGFGALMASTDQRIAERYVAGLRRAGLGD